MGILKRKLNIGRKGQLQIQETILTVFIFIVLIMLGMIFFYRVQSSSIEGDFKNFELDKLSIDFITLGDLPELSCSRAGIKESCIDTAKLAVFMSSNNTKDSRNYYFDRFGYKSITINQVYPNKNSNKCSYSRIEDCGVWELYARKPTGKVGSKIIRDTPVSLYYPKDDSYAIGILVVEDYET